MKHPLAWIPSLYFAEALPYVMIMTVSTVMYQSLGLGNGEVAFYTSLLYLPWVIKPLWSPAVEMLRTARWWIVAMQLLVGIGMAGVATTLLLPWWLWLTLACFYIMAFASATHDIAADGFYMHALNQNQQALYVGWRSTFYRGGMLFGGSALVWLAGWMEESTGQTVLPWTVVFVFTAVLFILLAAWHSTMLPRPVTMQRDRQPRIGLLFKDFFAHKHFVVSLLFILLYRLPEALLVKVSPLFLLAPDGMSLTKGELAAAQGLWGTVGLLAGGVVGGMLVARHGLRRWLWPMVAAITLPDLVYVWMAYCPQMPHYQITALIVLEQVGYGFGFTAYMLYLMHFSRGRYQTAHYAFCTGLMAAGMMLPGLVAGYIQEALGYQWFFLLVMALCAVTFGVAALVRKNLAED